MTDQVVCTYCGREGHRASHCPQRAKERSIEAYLVERVKAVGGEVRKVQWVSRGKAPDRLVMLPDLGCPDAHTIWVELKNPETIKTFPANAHERAQAREHERMRELGQRVEVIGTIEGVDALLG